MTNQPQNRNGKRGLIDVAPGEAAAAGEVIELVAKIVIADGADYEQQKNGERHQRQPSTAEQDGLA
jgi:hypothetical protein